jgi:hypothetical protein
MVWVAPCISLFLLIAGSAWAHAPYYTEVQRIAAPDGTAYELKLLRGDRWVFGGVPVRAVVVDWDCRAADTDVLAHTATGLLGCEISYMGGAAPRRGGRSALRHGYGMDF